MRKLARVLGVAVGGGGVEGDLHALVAQPVDAVAGDLQSGVPGAGEPVGMGVDAHHPRRLDEGAAQRLVHQIGADVSRAEDGGVNFFGHANLTLAPPTVPICRRITSPARTGSSGTSDPDKITSPALSGTPNAPMVFASQATEWSGDPSAAAPAPVDSNSPFFSTTMPQVTKSTRRGSAASRPRTNK